MRKRGLSPLPVTEEIRAPNPLRRDASLYHLPPDASHGQWNLLRVGREFDSSTGNLTESMIDRLNEWASREESFRGWKLRGEGWDRVPKEILLLDGSPSRLPLSGETARVIEAFLADHELEIPVQVVNRRDAIFERVAQDPHGTLILSQTAQRSLYDAHLAEALERRGVVVVPGPLTAPGGPLSNKKTTYEMLEGIPPHGGNGPAGLSHRLTARYQAVETNGNGAARTAEAILTTAASLSRKWGASTFFVKPQEGGGGRGCFRMDVLPGGFALPDLSRLGIPAEEVHPIPLPLDPGNRNHVRALAWVASRFSASSATSRAYLHNNRLQSSPKGAAATALLTRLLRESRPLLSGELLRQAEPFLEAREKLARAIENYEQLFGVPYQPLICESIDFGLFSLRAHMRLGRGGPVRVPQRGKTDFPLTQAPLDDFLEARESAAADEQNIRRVERHRLPLGMFPAALKRNIGFCAF